MLLSKEMMYNIYPPHDKPWLISAERSIDESLIAREEIINRWLQRAPFPGNESSKLEKIDWHRQLCNMHHEEYQARLEKIILEEPPQAYEVVRHILSQNAPSCILLRLKITRSDLEKISLENAEDFVQFSQKIPEFGHEDYQGTPSWAAYKKWLLSTYKAEEEMITLGNIRCSPDDVLIEKCMEFSYNLGLERYVSGVDEDTNFGDKNQWGHYGLFEKMKENLFHPLRNGVENRTSGFCVVLKTRVFSCAKDEASFEFQSNLRLLKRKYLKTCSPKTFIIFSRQVIENDQDEGKESGGTSNNHEVLWVPHEFLQYDNRISSHLSWGEGENSNIRERLSREDNVDAANLKAEMISRELNVIKHEMTSSNDDLSWRKKFCAALALTKNIAQDTWWMNENEYPDRVAKLIKDLATFWRINLLKKSDKLLGIGITEENDNPEKEISSSRSALYKYLGHFESYFNESECAQEIEFNWKPKFQALSRTSHVSKRRRIVTE